jgi:hypothetical protein
MVVDRDPVLLEVVGATAPPGRLARGLHRREEQTDERADDGDHHQQFDEGETAANAPTDRSAHETPVPFEGTTKGMHDENE